ncbi:MAG: glycosyltransferase [Patescibacteria group bacterium]|jgi:glycosyltransferase involved in cell wall biosynthesis
MGNKEIKISACLVVYNEAKNIRRCLESLREAVDEIIVVHDGECQDETLEICREYDAKIFLRPHVGIMEAHLVLAIEQASGDWLLRIDADEFLSDELKNSLRRLVKEAEEEGLSAYSFRWLSHYNGRFLPGKNRKSILFKKIDLYWFSMPHLAWQTRGRMKISTYILGHQVKDYSTAQADKQKRWAMIQAEYILKDFKELDNFQAERTDWLKTYSFSRQQARSRLLPLLKFLKSFWENIVHGAGLKETWRQGKYNYYLGKYIFKLSRKG